MNCLLILFEGAGLFEDGDTPRLRYADARAKCYARMEAEGRQRWRALVVETINPLLADADAAGRFWSYVKRWSMRFQHLLYARQITVDFADPHMNCSGATHARSSTTTR